MLDFVGIYIKEMKKKNEQNHKNFDSIDLIKGLLKALQVAHSDRNMILFERIKTVISMMAKGSTQHAEDQEESGDVKQNKIIMTEIMSQLLK